MKLFRTIFLLLLNLSLLSHSILAQQTTSPIKNVVVLVMENRSFDHIIGWMKKSINPRVNGVNGTECNPISTKPGSSQTDTVCVTDDAVYVDPDPGHSFDAVTQQVFGSNSSSVPTMAGFVEQALSMSLNVTDTVMKGFKPENVPVYSALVSEFAIFDRWFSSLPGPTQPNRLFVYSATSHGATSHVTKDLIFGYPQKTIFDSLNENHLDFAVYFESVPSVLFYRSLRQLKYVFNLKPGGVSKFKADAANGELPPLSVIEPQYFDRGSSPANDDHPSHDVANGQRLVKEIYEALRASPQWNQSLLVITYDEHGGFYDHVQTPFLNVPNPDGNRGPDPNFFNFDRLGVRVPAIMVSPWINKGTVLSMDRCLFVIPIRETVVVSKPNGPTPSSEFEHSSIPATIKKIFNLTSDFLNRRDAWAGTFEGVVAQLTSPRTDCPVVLPDATPLRTTKADEDRGLSEFQKEMVQLAAILNGDHYSNSFPDGLTRNMSVKQAHYYIKGAVSRFIRASKEALKIGANESTIVDMRSSLTSRPSIHN
ncbi:hypothetical protein V2J09_006148 [Rumex salicifolius]